MWFAYSKATYLKSTFFEIFSQHRTPKLQSVVQAEGKKVQWILLLDYFFRMWKELKVAKNEMKIEIWSHHGDSTWYTQPIWPKFGRFFCLCTTSPPIWLQISSHFGQFCVPFISPKHNKAVEFFGLFSKLGWEGFLKKFNEKLEANSAASRVFQKFF